MLLMYYYGESTSMSHGRSLLWSTSLLLFSCSVVSDSLWPHGLQHARLPCPSTSPGVPSNSCPSSQWCQPSHPVISFSSCLQSVPGSGSFPMNWLFTSGGQSIGASYHRVKLGKPVFVSLSCMKTFKIKSYQCILLGNEDVIENSWQRWYYQDHILSMFYWNHSTTKTLKRKKKKPSHLLD